MAEGARRILLIEDAPQVAGILVSKLGREGHKVAWVRGRTAALEALSTGSFDLIVLSTYLLPERNAWELLDELRGKVGAPIFMLLEAEEAGLEARAREHGAAGIILKPFKPTQVAKSARESFAGAT